MNGAVSRVVQLPGQDGRQSSVWSVGLEGFVLGCILVLFNAVYHGSTEQLVDILILKTIVKW